MRMGMLVFVAWCVVSVAHASPYQIDLSSQSRYADDVALRRHQQDLCALSGPTVMVRNVEIRVLAASVVVFARHRWRSLWGHIGLRFLVCEGEALRDVQFEYYRYSDVTEANLAKLYPDEDFALDAGYAHSLIGGLIVHRREPEADGGFLGLQLDKNREAYALWLDITDDQLAVLYRRNEDRFTAQLARLRNKQPLEQPYGPMSRNCTHHLQEDLPGLLPQPLSNRLRGSIFPMRYLRQIEAGPVWLRVMHPSVHAWHRVTTETGWPETTHRLRPWMRNYRAVPSDTFPQEAPTPAIVTALLAKRQSRR
jgi:hypothetical protein